MPKRGNKRTPNQNQALAKKYTAEKAFRRELTISNCVRYLFYIIVIVAFLAFVLCVVETLEGCRDHTWIVSDAQEWEYWKKAIWWITDHWGYSLSIPGASALGTRWVSRNKKVEYLASRNKKLEQIIDPGRTTSKIQKNGKTRKGDK